MSRSRLLRGVSAGAFAVLYLSSSALTQETLPTIDVGAARRAPARQGRVPPGTERASNTGASSTGAPAEDPTTYHPENATTATKTNTPIMETPVSIQVVPQQVIQDQAATTLARVVDNVSGVRSIDPAFDGGLELFQVRGFRTFNTYVDGLRISNGNGNPTSLINVDRVEVLKGPASILYGRADPGGIINIVTKKPQATPRTAVEQQIGSYDSYRTTLDTTGPLTKDGALLYRLTAEVDHDHSFREFYFLRNYFVSPVVQWNIDAATQATVNFQYNHRVNPYDTGSIAFTKYDPLAAFFGEGPVSFLPRGRNFGEPNSNNRIDEMKFGFNWSHKFNEDWVLTQRFQTVLTDINLNAVLPFGFDPIVPTQLNRQAYRVFAQDQVYATNFDLTGKFDTFGIGHTVLLGGDLLSEHFALKDAISFSPPNIDYLFPIHSFPTSTAWDLFDPNASFFAMKIRTQWYGFYLQDQIKLPYNFFLMAGARYDHAIQHQNFMDGQGETVADNSQRVTPRFGLLWRPIPELSIYGSYLTNFGQAAGTSGPIKQPLPPETAQQWEVGVKTELLDKRLTATLAYYNLIKQHVAAPDPDPARAAQGFLVSLGEVRNKGVEFDVAGEILPGLKVISSYAYIDSIVAKDSGEVFDPLGNIISENGFAGYTPPGVSRHMGSLWTTYEFQNGDWRGLKFGGGANARSKSFGDSLNSFHLPGYATVGLMAAYNWMLNGNKLTAQLNVDNLLDTRYYPNGLSALGVNVGTPRTFKGSIRMAF